LKEGLRKEWVREEQLSLTAYSHQFICKTFVTKARWFPPAPREVS
jgi:hypothetical protein